MTEGAEVIHVAGDGDDRNDGSASAPFATIERACDWLVERRRAGARDRTLEVRVHAGLYRLARPASIGPETSGAGKVVIRGEGPGRTLLADCVPVLPRPVGRLLHAVELPSQLGVPLDIGTFGYAMPQPTSPPVLLRDGRRLPWARWPDAPSLRGAVVAPRRRFFTRRPAGLTIAVDPRALDGLGSRDDLWIEMVVGDPWRWFMARIGRIDVGTGQIETSLRADLGAAGGPVSQIGFHNVRTKIDRDHALLDPRRRRILLGLSDPAEAATASFELCTTDAPLIHVTDAANVEISDLGLYGGLGTAVVVERSDRVTIERCHVREFGFGGIDASGSEISIAECEVRDVGTGGIRLSSGNAAELRSGSSRIARCRIRDWARRRRVYEPAVRLHGVGSEVTDCDISDGPHMGLAFDGNDHVVARNRFARVARDFSDMGAIYLNLGEQPLMRGTVIAGNLFQDIGGRWPLTPAVYADRGSSGVTVSGNLFVRVGSPSDDKTAAIYANGSSDLRIARNLFVDCRTAFLFAFYLADWGRRDLEAMQKAWAKTKQSLADPSSPHRRAYPELERFSSEDRIFPPSNRFTDNVVLTNATAADGHWQIQFGPAERVQQQGNLALQDPLELSCGKLAILTLIAGLSPEEARRAVDQAGDDWPAVAARLGLDKPSAE